MLHKIFAHISLESPKSGTRSRLYMALLLTVTVLLGLSFDGVANAKTTANPATTAALSHQSSSRVKNQRNFSPRKPLASAQKTKQMAAHPNSSGIFAELTDFSYFPSFDATSGFEEPFGVAVDYLGDIYVGDAETGTVYMETPISGGGYTQSVVASGFEFIYGINVDGNLNVYVDDYGTGILYIEVNNYDGTYTQGVVDATLGEPLDNVEDAYGDVYVADGLYGVVEEVNNGNGTYTAYQIDNGSFVSPNAVALDAYGNLYVGDYIYTSGYSIVYSLPAYGYGGPSFGPPTLLTDDLYGVSGLAVASNGTLYVSDTGLGEEPSVLYSLVPTAQGNYNQFFLTDNVYEAIDVAVDSLGNVYTADIEGDDVLEVSTNFGAVQVGFANGTNNYVTANFDLSGSGTVGPLVVSTSGDTGVAFSDSGLGNCAGLVVSGSTYCSAVIQFAPTVPGLSTGSIALYDTSANYITFTPTFSGTGIAPRSSFFPGTYSYVTGEYTYAKQSPNFAKLRAKEHLKMPKTSLHNAAKGMQIGALNNYPGDEPDGIAIDDSGNYFVADVDYCEVFAYFQSTGTWTALPGSGYAACPTGGLAVDGNGNVIYPAYDAIDDVEVIAADANVGTQFGTPTYYPPYIAVYYTNTGSGNLYYANNVAVDAYDNIYFTGSDDSYDDAYAYVVPLDGWFFGDDYSAVSRLPYAFDYLSGISVDGYGDIALSDYYLGEVFVEFPETNGVYDQVPIIRSLDTPVAVEWTPYGNLFIADSGDDTGISALYYGYPNGVCCYGNYGFNLIPFALSYYEYGDAYFWNFTTDSNDNFYLTDDGYWGGLITQIDVNDPPTINFDTTDIGVVSVDSPETVYLADTGNDTLVLPVPASGFNPSISPSFLLNSSYYVYFPGGQVPAFDCPLIASGGTAGAVDENAPCALPVSFEPLVAGAITGTLVVTDNSLYGSSSVPLAKGAKPEIKGRSSLPLTKDGKLAKNAHPLVVSTVSQTINLNGIGVDFFSVDFTVTGTTGLPVVKAGGSLALQLIVAPTAPATTIPEPVTMGAIGAPQGSTYAFSPAVITAGSGTTTVTLTITVPIQFVAQNDVPQTPGQKNNGTKLPVVPLALALLFLPMAGKLRKAGKRMSRMVALMILAIAGITATATLIGCGSNTKAIYEITVTGTSGILSHSTSFDIVVEGN